LRGGESELSYPFAQATGRTRFYEAEQKRLGISPTKETQPVQLEVLIGRLTVNQVAYRKNKNACHCASRNQTPWADGVKHKELDISKKYGKNEAEKSASKNA
jgi:hypothetical protein